MLFTNIIETSLMYGILDTLLYIATDKSCTKFVLTRLGFLKPTVDSCEENSEFVLDDSGDAKSIDVVEKLEADQKMTISSMSPPKRGATKSVIQVPDPVTAPPPPPGGPI